MDEQESVSSKNFREVPQGTSQGELSIDSSRILSMSYYIFDIVLGTRKFSTLTKRYLLSIRETDTKNRETREEVFEAEARYEPQ
jgi:hypothetical protein